VKPTTPGSYFLYICFAIYFICSFYSDLLNQKFKNTLLHFILFVIYYFNLLQFSPVSVPISVVVTRKGLTTPLTRQVASGCYLCAGAVYVMFAWFSYWFDNLCFISKGNTYCRCAASSLPLWGKTDVASSDIKRNFWRRCRGGSST